MQCTERCRVAIRRGRCAVWGMVLAISAVAAPARGQCDEQLIAPAPEWARFGEALAIDGDVAVVGAPQFGVQHGRIWIMRYDGAAWQIEAMPVPSNLTFADRLGHSVAVRGNTVFAGAPGFADQGHGEGRVFIYRYEDDEWTLSQEIPGLPGVPTALGESLAVDGDTLFVGAPGTYVDETTSAGAVYVYTEIDGTWVETAVLTAPAPTESARFGSAIALDGDHAIVGAPAEDEGPVVTAGAVYFAHRERGRWTVGDRVVALVRTPFARFGWSVGLDAGRAAVGAPSFAADDGVDGRVETWRLVGSDWVHGGTLVSHAGNDDTHFGAGLALRDGRLLVGASSGLDGTTPSGAVYHYAATTEAWSFEGQLRRAGPDVGDQFGSTVATDGSKVLVGAPFDDTAEWQAGSVSAFDFDASGVDCDDPASIACDSDCNGNGIPDSCDIADGADDCNGNGIPDECDVDCDGNGVPDDCEIAKGAEDCNANGILDSCEADCNGNGVADECDIANGTSIDCDGNGVPDECEPDCNANGVTDACDISSGVSEDCNDNGVPDECDAATGDDCNGDLVPDECQINDFVVDNGSTLAFAVTYGSEICWLNGMTVMPNASTITSVSIMTANLVEGTPVTILVYSDPTDDGNPIDAQLLTSVEILAPPPPQFDVFTRVDVPPTYVGEVGEIFYVGAYCIHGFTGAAAAIDDAETSLEVSWAAGGPGDGSLDPADLAGAPFPLTLLADADIPNTFMIRADATHPGDIPHGCGLPGDADQDGMVTVADLILLLSQWGPCPALPAPCPSDLDGDGSVGTSDLLIVIANWS